MQKVRVLAVDDQEFNLDLIELTFMEMEHVEVTKAQNGKEAMDALCADGGYDVILLDLAMPVMNGFDTLEALQNSETLCSIPVIVVTANAEEKNRALEHGATDFLNKPFDVEELKLRTLNYARISDYQKNLESKVRERTRELDDALKIAKQTEYEISSRLGKASEYRDLETGMHIKRMSHYSAKLAELYGLESEEVELVLYASPLHDIGKVGIPDRILLKPGRFSEAEFEIMKLHAQLGAQMLEGGDEYPVVHAGRLIAEQHHEKFDGTGYPKGLKGEQIHIYGRIVAIADVFDALSSERVYKPAFGLDKALAIMEEGRATHFDPELLDLFFGNLETFLQIKEAFPDDEATPSILDLIHRHEAKETS